MGKKIKKQMGKVSVTFPCFALTFRRIVLIAAVFLVLVLILLGLRILILAGRIVLLVLVFILISGHDASPLFAA